ncbi:uncharacterized protein LOC142765418 isoform X3 [Rhipicephalus microplus]|uniref:uncharacterized protein LOC142765418 isoform X3 n=1 Tax=Rhipicephalus microplus TaxID=6941 RepID=UPI003F6AAE77
MLYFFQSPPPLSPVAGPSGPQWSPSPNTGRSNPRSPGLAPEVVLPGPSWSPPPLSPVAGPSGPQWLPSPYSPLLRDTLRMLAPRPGEPGSEGNPGTIEPGPTQLKIKNEKCYKRYICEEGTCCLDFGGVYKRCKPLAKRGEHCVKWAITTVYVGVCPCDPNEGTCQFGICM